MQKSAEVTRDWILIDVKDQVLGRVATNIASKLIGKHKPSYTPHIESGDYVVVINAKDVAVTGNKETDKIYYKHSGYVGNLRETTLGEMRAKHPERLIEKAVFNMLPKNRLRSLRMARLKVYAGADHPHQSQIKDTK